MKKSTTQQIGGLVLKTNELISILNGLDTVGLAFGLTTPGVPNGVDLIVYKVHEDNGQLIGQSRKIEYKGAAAKYDDFVMDMQLFKFQFEEDLIQKGFGFAYISKEEFVRIVGSEEEVYIAGGHARYGDTGQIAGDWFTLSLTARKLVVPTETILSMGVAPSHTFMAPCPPIWTRLDDDTSDGEIIFNKK